MKLVTVSAPDYSTAPVTLSEVKTHLRVDGADEDYLIDIYRRAAAQYVADLCGRPLAPGSFRAEYERWCSDGLTLPLAPVSAVSSVKYRDSAEAEQVVSTAVYLADIAAEPARVVLRYGQSWPTATLSPSRPILIAFSAGYAAGSCPEPIRLAILLLCSHWYEHREAVVIGDASSAVSVELERGVKALLGRYMLDFFGASYGQDAV